MNISMIVMNTFTHDARVMKEAMTLQACGHRVTVNALWAAGLSTEETVEGINVRRICLGSRERKRIPFLPWVEFIAKVVAAVRSQGPDVCHAHDLKTVPAGYVGSKVTGSRLIYDSHELETDRNPNYYPDTRWKRWVWRQAERLLIGRADGVITVSPSIAAELARLYGISPPVVIRNCPDLIDLPSPGSLRSWLGLPKDSQIILYQGGLQEGRGLENLLRAVAQVPEATLVLLGDGPSRPRLEALGRELGIEGRLFLPGIVPLRDLLRYTRDAQLGVYLYQNTCLSHYYTLPNKLFEYLMAGVPVLVSDFPDIRQILRETGAGMAVDPDHIGAIADGLRRMLSDPEALMEMSRRARLAAETRYNWQMESQALLLLYNAYV
jgi:glycosyltransferase involved in cell wall biosynthesis